jgi:TonB family protein
LENKSKMKHKTLFQTVFIVFFITFLLPFAQAQKDSTVVVSKPMEVVPEYPGGTPALVRFITEHLRYPKKARRKGIEGVVLATFTIDEQGKLTHPKIKKGLEGGCNEEVLRLIGLMEQTWKAGMQQGKSVRVQYTLPVRFKLE